MVPTCSFAHLGSVWRSGAWWPSTWRRESRTSPGLCSPFSPGRLRRNTICSLLCGEIFGSEVVNSGCTIIGLEPSAILTLLYTFTLYFVCSYILCTFPACLLSLNDKTDLFWPARQAELCLLDNTGINGLLGRLVPAWLEFTLYTLAMAPFATNPLLYVVSDSNYRRWGQPEPL